MRHKCYGSCEPKGDDGYCAAEDIVLVEVSAVWLANPWQFHYCKEAIEADRANGFKVTEVGKWFKRD